MSFGLCGRLHRFSLAAIGCWLGISSVVADPFDPITSPGSSLLRFGNSELGVGLSRGLQIRGEVDGKLLIPSSPVSRIDPSSGEFELMDVPWIPELNAEAVRGTTGIAWLRNFSDSNKDPVRVTNLFSGEVLGEFPFERVFGSSAQGPGVLDERGLVFVGRNRIVRTDVMGEGLVEIPFDAGTQFDQVRLKVMADSFVLRRSDPVSNGKIYEAYDRGTLDQHSMTVLNPRFIYFDAAGERMVVASTVDYEFYDIPGFRRAGRFTAKELGLDRISEVHLAEQTLWLMGWSELGGERVLALDLRSGTPVLQASFDGFHRLSSLGDGVVLATDDYLAQAGSNDSELVIYRLAAAKAAWIEMDGGAREGSPVRGQVRLARAQPVDVDFQVSAQSGVAVEGEDFPEWSENVTIAAGSLNGTFEIPTLADSVLEAHETFEVRLDVPSGFERPKPLTSALILGTGPTFDLYTSQDNAAAWGVSPKLGWTRFIYADDDYFLGERNGGQLWLAEAGGATLIRAIGLDRRFDPSFVTRRNTYLFLVDSDFSSDVIRLSLDGSEEPVRTRFAGKFRGLADDNHLISARGLEWVQVFRISDGEMVQEKNLGEGFGIPNTVENPSGLADGVYALQKKAGIWPDRRDYLVLEVRDPVTLELIEEKVWPSPIEYTPTRVVARSGTILVVENYLELRAIDLADGGVLWSHQIWNSSLSNLGSYTLKDGLLFCGEVDFKDDGLTSGGEVTLIDLKSGLRLETFDLFDTGVAQETMNYRARFVGIIQAAATPSGWWVSSGRHLLHIHRAPRRPRMEPVAITMRDNETRDLLLPQVEQGSGSVAPVISEKRPEIDLWPLEHGAALLDGMGEGALADGVWRSPVGLLDALKSSRSAFAYLAEPGWPIGLLGGVKFQLSSHRERVNGKLLDPQAPPRQSKALSLAYHRDLLAVAYPNEDTEHDDGRRGLVDIYDLRSGKFMRSFSAPQPENSAFGAAIAFAGEDLLCIGSPGRGLVSESRGAVHVYHASSGESLGSLQLPGVSRRFGRTLAGCDEYIAVSSFPGNVSSVDSAAFRESVTLYLVDGLKRKFTKTFTGESFGESLAFGKDRLLVGSPTASTAKARYSGLVRVFELPLGRERGSMVPAFPRGSGYFGRHIAANSDRVIVGPERFVDFDIDGFIEWDGLALKGNAYHGMPEGLAQGALSLVDDIKLQGHAPLRLFRGNTLRPYASLDLNPAPMGSSVSLRPVVVSNGEKLYWVTEKVYQAPFPSPAGPGGGNSRRINRDDWVVNRVGSHGLGELLTSNGASSNEAMNLRLRRVDNPMWGSVLESSFDLKTWKTMLSWSRSRSGWIGIDGQFYPVESSGGLDFEVPFEQSCLFFRVRLRLEP